jgi:hypothetical protein
LHHCKLLLTPRAFDAGLDFKFALHEGRNVIRDSIIGLVYNPALSIGGAIERSAADGASGKSRDPRLISLALSKEDPWLIAMIGRLPGSVLVEAGVPNNLARSIEPVTLLSESANWIATRAVATNFQFLLQQNM